MSYKLPHARKFNALSDVLRGVTRGLLVVSALLLIAACASIGQAPINVQTVEANGADFSTQRTFFILPQAPDSNGRRPEPTFARQEVESAVRTELNERRYQEVRDHEQADLLVAVQFSMRNDQRLTNVVDYDYEPAIYDSFGFGHGNRTYYGNYGYAGFGFRNYYGYQPIAESSLQVRDFREENLIVDLVDRRANKILWEGHARENDGYDLNNIRENVTTIVSRLFDKYPYVAASPAVAAVSQ